MTETNGTLLTAGVDAGASSCKAAIVRSRAGEASKILGMAAQPVSEVADLALEIPGLETGDRWRPDQLVAFAAEAVAAGAELVAVRAVQCVLGLNRQRP